MEVEPVHTFRVVLSGRGWKNFYRDIRDKNVLEFGHLMWTGVNSKRLKCLFLSISSFPVLLHILSSTSFMIFGPHSYMPRIFSSPAFLTVCLEPTTSL